MQELSFIKEYFSSFLVSEIAKKIFYQRTYFTNTNALNFDLKVSQEVLDFCEQYHSFTFCEVFDIRESIEFSKKNYVLDHKEVYQLYILLEQWKQLTNLSVSPEEFPNFYQMINELYLPRELDTYWKNTFDREGNIADTASQELKRIRSLKKTLRKKIEKIIQNTLNNNEDLAEKRIAFREDRYVLPIKSSAKNRTQGIVHGFSGSGLITYIEPIEIVSLNNELLSVDDLEQQEIHRLLRQWSLIISKYSNDILIILSRMADIEILFAKYLFAKNLKATFASLNLKREIVLDSVYNPFLLIKKGRKNVIPITISLESNKSGIIISGPNAGGKSAALKTLALCAELFLIGLPIPANFCSLPLFSQILIEIGDSQNLDNDLSTFSGHLNHLKNILECSQSNSLVLIDEIAHATDPLEGEALGCAIIDELIKKGCFFAITTHYKQIKLKSFENSYIKTYATGFDPKTFTPRFILYPDTIGESYALNIASSIGLSPWIVESAQKMLKEKQTQSEIILSNIEEHEKKMRQKEQELQQKAQELETLEMSLIQEKHTLAKASQKIKEKGIEYVDKELNDCLRELSHIKKNIADDVKNSTKKIKKYQEIVYQKKEEIVSLSYQRKTQFIKGDSVFIASLKKTGVVEQILDNFIIVRIGIVKISVKKSDIFESHQSMNNFKKNNIRIKKHYFQNLSHQVDVHGMTSEEAINTIDKYLYEAFAAGLNEFTILHGKGKGILQKSVQQYLSTIPEVKNFHFTAPHEGGSGRTIVYFIK